MILTAALFWLLQTNLTTALIVPRFKRKLWTTPLSSTCVKEDEEQEVSLYQVLGIPRHASTNDIKQAFRRKARQYHPDMNPNPDSTEIFQDINNAYQVLNDPGLKLQYDLFGPPDVEYTSVEGKSQSALAQEGPGPAKLTQASVIPGDDLQFYLQVGFQFAANGGKVKIPIRRLETCEMCRGKEIKPGSKLYDEPCSSCFGRGRKLEMYRNPLGHIVEEVEECVACRGRKTHIEAFCECCQGTGHRMIYREVILDIPPGVRHGQVLRLPRCGNAGPQGGPLGDVYIFVNVKPPSMFAMQNLSA